MWKKVDGRLIQTTDESRVKLDTRISKQLLDELYILAERHNTNLSYLLETGFENIIKEEVLHFDKSTRLRDKVRVGIYCDKELLNKFLAKAKESNLMFTDAIQASIKFIDPEKSKKKEWKSRIE